MSAHRTLRFSLSTAFVFTVVLTALAIGAVSFFSIRTQMREELRKRLGDVAVALSHSIEPAKHAGLKTPDDMTSSDYLAFRALFKQVRTENSDLRFLYTLRTKAGGGLEFILDSGETEEDFSPLGSEYEDLDSDLVVQAALKPPYKVMVGEDFYTDKWGSWLSAYAPVLQPDGTLECVLGLDMSAGKVIESETRLLVLFSGITLVISVAGILIGLIFSRSISKPLLRLAEDMGHIQTFNLETDPAIPSTIHEVQLMKSALENMKKGLRSFKKYVPSDVVAQLISLDREAVLETEKRQLTLFFSDLENFTGVSEGLKSEELAEVLGGYFDAMTRTLHDSGATVDKYIGDSVMAFWNAPLAADNHAAAACRAALACQRALRPLHEDWKARGIPFMKTRIGLNTGECIVGNIGYEGRLSYTAVGDTVNLASRLEGLNKYYGTTILCSGATWDQVKDQGITGRLVDKVAVKGKTQGIFIHEILTDQELPSGWNELLRLHAEALELYFASRFDDAGKIFARIVKSKPDDGPARVMLERCQKYSAQSPGAAWDGVYIMGEK